MSILQVCVAGHTRDCGRIRIVLLHNAFNRVMVLDYNLKEIKLSYLILDKLPLFQHGSHYTRYYRTGCVEASFAEVFPFYEDILGHLSRCHASMSHSYEEPGVAKQGNFGQVRSCVLCFSGLFGLTLW